MKKIIPFPEIGNKIVDEMFRLYRDKLVVFDGAKDISALRVNRIKDVSGTEQLSISLPDGILTEKELETIIQNCCSEKSEEVPTKTAEESVREKLSRMGLEQSEIDLLVKTEQPMEESDGIIKDG